MVDSIQPAVLIEVSVLETGDWVTCASPEAAVAAAHHIGWEAKNARGIQGFDPTLVFRVDDKIVRTSTLRALNR